MAFNTSLAARIGRVVTRHLPALAARIALLPASRPTSKDPYHAVFRHFVAHVNAIPAAKLLEIGSRARSGNIYTSGFCPVNRPEFPGGTNS